MTKYTIWELPQNIIGWIIKKVLKAKFYTRYNEDNVYTWKMDGGISLGEYIFVPFDETTNASTEWKLDYIRHEYGHTRQSHYLSWLYLIVIGLPSLLWAWKGQDIFNYFRMKLGKKPVTYYWLYTEKWADSLGGVER